MPASEESAPSSMPSRRPTPTDRARRGKDVWAPPDLAGGVAVVTGASYGAGRGVAEVLGECGATVYVTGRTTRSRSGRVSRAGVPLPEGDPSGRWTIEETAEQVTRKGGRGIPVPLDHTKDARVAKLFERIERTHGRLDVLVNNVWQWGPEETYVHPTWEQPPERWDAMMGVGVRSQFVATRFALPLMVRSRRGVVVFTQERPGDDRRFLSNVVVDVAATAQQRLAKFVTFELRRHARLLGFSTKRLAAVLVWLGWQRSVNMLEGLHGDVYEGMGGAIRMSRDEFFRRTQTPQFAGRAIAQLAADPNVGRKSGRTFYVGDLAREYGFTDTDGRRPRPRGAG